MMKSKGDKAVFERWVRRKKAGNTKSKGDPYILVVGHYRIITVKKSVTGAKNVSSRPSPRACVSSAMAIAMEIARS